MRTRATGLGKGRYGGWRLLGPALVLLGLVGVLIGAVSAVGTARAYYALHPRSVVADATVTQVLFRKPGEPSGPPSRAMVEFITLSGPVKEVVPVGGVKVGARLRVTYDRENPAIVRLTDQAGAPNLGSAVPILLGGLLVAGIGVAGPAIRIAARVRRLP
jgi:hypothetical protein